jgi:hypothetical protein
MICLIAAIGTWLMLAINAYLRHGGAICLS